MTARDDKDGANAAVPETEIWSRVGGSPRIYKLDGMEAFGIELNGHVVVKSLEDWHRLGRESFAPSHVAQITAAHMRPENTRAEAGYVDLPAPLGYASNPLPSAPSTTPRSGETPRMDAALGKGADWVFAQGCQLERELVEFKLNSERAIAALVASRSATPQKYDFLHDDRFTGAFIEQFIEEWMAPAAFANHDEQVFLNFAVALAHDLVHGPFDEFCAKVPIEQHLPNNSADGGKA